MSPLVVVSLAAFIAASTAAGAQSLNTQPGAVQEPLGLHQGGDHGYTPSSIRGGAVLDTPRVTILLQTQSPLLIDVAELDRKPPDMHPGMLWLPQHRSLPKAVWLPGAGSPTSDPVFDEALKTEVARLTHEDKEKPIIVFCHPDCWASYNAARRVISYGYNHVYWYRDGMEGWQNAHETAVIKPDSYWLASKLRSRS